jgi:hypothetical protein
MQAALNACLRGGGTPVERAPASSKELQSNAAAPDQVFNTPEKTALKSVVTAWWGGALHKYLIGVYLRIRHLCSPAVYLRLRPEAPRSLKAPGFQAFRNVPQRFNSCLQRCNLYRSTPRWGHFKYLIVAAVAVTMVLYSIVTAIKTKCAVGLTRDLFELEGQGAVRTIPHFAFAFILFFCSPRSL